MNPSPPSISTRTVLISGITVDLAKRLKRPILVELSIDNTESRSVLLKPEENSIGERTLQVPLNLRDKSILSIRVQEKHRLRADKSLAQTNLSLDNIWPMQEPAPHDTHSKKYQVHLSDPDYHLWLNVSWLSLSSQSNSDDVGQTSQALENVPREQDQAEESLKAASQKAVQKLRDFKTALDRLGRAKNPVETMLNFGTAISELNPIAKAVLASINVFYNQMKTQAESHQDILVLAEGLERIVDHIQPVKDIAKLDALKKTLETFPELMKETAEVIETFVGQNSFANFVLTPYNKEKIENLKRRHAVLQQEFDRGIKVDGAVKMNSLIELQELKELEDRLLGKIKFVDPRSTECIEGTRTRILMEVDARTDDQGGSNIIWIRGAPGCGKSSISLTTKSRLRGLGRLVTYFRFDRNEAATTTSNALWRCVAYDLARRLPAVRPRLLQQLRNDKVDLDSSVAVFTSLVEVSLSELTDTKSLPDHPLVIVIDALDECGGLEGRSSLDRKALLQTLGRWSKLPKHFKLLATSREESDIVRVLSDISTPIDIRSGHFLTENPQAEAAIDVTSDIRMFLTGRFRDISECSSSLPTDWPGTKTITEMVHRAGGIFMWATTVANFIELGIDPGHRLRKIMGSVPESSTLKPLYSLYTVILEMSFGDIVNDDSEAEALQSVLGTMVLAKRPLDDVEYTKLPTTAPVTEQILDFIRDKLRSVVAPGALRFIHKSFDDFLLSNDCPPKFAIRTQYTQHLLAKLSLKTMSAELRFNICNLETSCLKNVDIPDIKNKVANGIPALLSYSCCYWADHLTCTALNQQLVGLVKEFMFKKLLYWFEAMSLLEQINWVSHSLLRILSWAEPASDGELNDIIHDAHRFIGAFGHPISQSASHIYLSALPFAPERSPIAKHFLPQFPRILAVSVGKPADWSPCVFTSEHHNGDVCSVCFSPDEKCFVSGSHDGTICICDSETGNLILGPLGGTNRVTSCFFAPDGRRVWARHENRQVIGWDVETGDKHVEFQAGGIMTSLIGCCCSASGQEIITATSSGKVTLWDAYTGEQLSDAPRLFSGHWTSITSFSRDGGYIACAGLGGALAKVQKLDDGSSIYCQCPSYPHFSRSDISALSFSVDGDTVVGGLKEGAIVIWDAKTGDMIGRPLDTGKGGVSAVAYSHENNILVSASDDPGTVMVWNAKTHEVVLGPLEGHTSSISAIALSRDGRRALTASVDKTVRMWDLGGKGVVPATNAKEGGHTEWVRCLAFSPCGKMLASLDRTTIRVWDASTGKPLLNPISNLSPYDTVIFSPDNSLIVAFYRDLHQAWNANNGEPAFPLKSGQYIYNAAFRSTGQLVASGFDGVYIWSLEDTGASRSRPIFPGTSVYIIALSPDGLTAMVRDFNTYRHYIWNTKTCQPLPFTFTDNEHILGDKVAFSPSGKFFVAASEEGTLRVWDTRTGELSAGPFMLNHRLAHLAFSPDDCHIAFSYSSKNADQTEIWIWNAKTCRMASGPWKAHTDSIMALAFSSDGGKLASGSLHGQVGIWNTTDLLGHSGVSSGFLNVGTRMKDGWVTDTTGNMLFWVPKDHRSGLAWSQNVGIVIGGQGIRTELDLTRFSFGEHWTECSEGEQ